MIKKSVDDAVFDAVLAKAFEDAAERDLAEMQTEDVPEYSEAYKKMERRYYNKVKRQSRARGCRAGFAPVLKRVVSFVLIIGFVSCCVMLSAPTIRAEFMGLVTKFFDEYFSIITPNNVTTYETENFVFEYIPSNYYATETLAKPFLSTFTFSSSQTNHSFIVSIHSGTNVSSQHDTLFTNTFQIHINEYSGYIIESTDDNRKEIIWTDNLNVYSVSGNISEQELIKIAENIFLKIKK